MNESKLQRRVRLLTVYVVLSNLLLLFFILTGFKNSDRKENMDELTVKRINIVDETGKSLRMVISNEKRQHPGIINGQELPPRERPAGIIFFNSAGDECGGLVYDGNDKEAGLVLSVDKFRNDQIMQLQYMEDTQTSTSKYGLQLWEYPKDGSFSERMQRFEEIEKLKSDEEKRLAIQKMKEDSLLMEERLFIGKKFNKEVGLFINDKNGKTRIRIYVDDNDNAKIEFLDKDGKLVK